MSWRQLFEHESAVRGLVLEDRAYLCLEVARGGGA